LLPDGIVRDSRHLPLAGSYRSVALETPTIAAMSQIDCHCKMVAHDPLCYELTRARALRKIRVLPSSGFGVGGGRVG